ncbi:MAG: hypothetical protein HY248_00770, partial [Fimbriimonas ginsengisoli]|nr:hypothetical protein [Fimbriimonas ginsengisoli]
MARLKARLVSLLMTLMALVALAPAQTYTPKAGETVLKLVIAERGNIFVTLYTKEAPK